MINREKIQGFTAGNTPGLLHFFVILYRAKGAACEGGVLLFPHRQSIPRETAKGMGDFGNQNF